LPLVLKKSVDKEIELEEAQITKRYQDNILKSTIIRITKSIELDRRQIIYGSLIKLPSK